jgi:hypothetical protein
LLRVTETEEGCIFLWIEGHRDLGYAFDDLILPFGVPSLYSQWSPQRN